jgi:TolB-like protein/DNA-binding winged helix-turn-helix (wHTH) protein/cytochrome c-type biogenesis protein CcmH/NrfG
VSSRRLRFDGWVLDPESGDLERSGARIRLQEQPVQVLRELIAHAGSVVPREQLIALLWPKGVVDFDTGLNTVVRKLRSALGDTSETPRYIETLPRRGYRFIGALDPDPEAAPGASAALRVSTPSGGSPRPAPPSHQEPTVPPQAGLAAPGPMPGGHDPAAREEATSSAAMTSTGAARPRFPALALIAALAVAALLTGVYALWRAGPGASITSAPVQAPSQSGLPANVASTSVVAFAPPLHSLAVLPFVNMSGDPNQDYFSDGLTEELLNSLSRINELQVAARTSSFSFQGEHPDLTTVAHKLNVASVLEGSVRRSGHTVRITAQLNNAVTGFHLWSQTYDRDLGDVLQLQTEIATAVAEALKIKLLGDTTERIEVGGTRNPAAYDAYLRGASAYWQASSASENKSVRASYQEAVRLDPNFALAYAAWSLALGGYAGNFAHGSAVGEAYHQAQAPALKAVALAPELAEGHLALALVRTHSLDFAGASDEFQRAMALAPGNARVLRDYGEFAVQMGRTDAGIAAARRAAALDPLNTESHAYLSGNLRFARRYDEALASYQDGLSLLPKGPWWAASVGELVYYALGDFDKMQALCEGVGEAVKDFQGCLALAYHKLGRQSDAETALARFKALDGDAGAYGYATIYAQWGDTPEALGWLETALRLRDPLLVALKAEPLLDPLRQEPRFKAIERELRFPN